MSKKVLITGCNGGIGVDISEKFNKCGYTVYGIDLDEEFDSNNITHYKQFDLNNPKWDELFKEDFDILINNAAIQIVKKFNDITDDEINTIFNINIVNVIRLIQKLNFNKGSSIINIGSIHSHQTKVGFSLYSATKGSLESLTRALSIELAPYTRVNMIRPAAIETPMLISGLSRGGFRSLNTYHPTQSIGNPNNISDIILSIVNNEFINGSIIDVDGGISNVLHDPDN